MQRQFSLEWFDVFISKTLQTANLNPSDITANFIRTSIQKAAEEKNNVRLALLREMFNASDEEGLRVSVKRYQLLLIHLLDELHQFKVRYNSSRLLNKLCNYFHECLKELLVLLENHFTCYFDLDQKIPDSYLSIYRTEISSKLDQLEKQLFDHKQDGKLVQILIDHLRAFTISHSVQVTYRDFTYVKNAWMELLHSTIYKKQGRNFPLLIELLVRINYNTPVFANYFLQEYVNTKLRGIGENYNKISTIHDIRKRLKEINRLPNLRMLNNQPDINDQIVELLLEESLFLEPAGTTHSNYSYNNPNDYKVQTTLPVPLLAAIFRVFKESGVILNSNIKKLLEFISNNYSSMKQENISYTHLHSSYYDIDPRNKERLYDMLMQLAKEVRKL